MTIAGELINILGFKLEGEQNLAKFNRGIDEAERNARNASRALSAMGVAIGTFVGNMATMAVTRLGQAIGSLPGQVIETGKMFEALQIRLETLEGSSEKAERAMTWIRQFAKDTPLQLAEVADAYADLRNYGIDPTNGSLQALTDAMAGSGKGSFMLGRLTLAIGQAWVKQKLQGQEILQLTEAGIPVWDMLAEATGKNVQELQKLSEKGKLGRQEIQLLIDAIQRKYVGASEKFARSFSGITSKLADEWTEFLANIGERGFYAEVKARLQGVFDTITRFRKDGTLAWLEQGFSDFLTGSMRATEHVALQVWRLGKGMYYAADGAAALVSRLTGLEKGTSAGLLGAGALASTGAGRKLLMGVARRVPFVAALLALDDIVTGFGGGKSKFADYIGKENIDRMKTAAGELKGALDNLFANTGIEVFKADLGSIEGSMKALKEIAVEAFRQMTEAIKTAKQAADALNGMLFGDSEGAKDNPRNRPGFIEQTGEVLHMDGSRIIDRPDENPTAGFTEEALDYKFLLQNLEGNRQKMGGDRNASAVTQPITDNSQDNRDQSVSVVVHQTVTQATAAAGAAAQATANAVLGAASQSNVTRDASESSF